MKKEEFEIPMGVSQWMNHGRKYGYWEYFKKQAREEILNEEATRKETKL